MEQVGIRAGGHETADQGVLKHVAGAPGVLANDDPGRAFLPLPAAELGEVPAQEAADLEGVVGGEGQIGFPAEAVGSEIFAHKLKTP